jgi:RTX calcium-binding nonapeptide repeat (4 copies)
MATPTKWGSEFLVNTITNGFQDSPTITKLADGRFLAAWTTDEGAPDGSLGGIDAQIFNADGSKSGAEFLVNTTTTSVQRDAATTGLSDGRFIVTWTDSSGIDSDVRGQTFNSDGTKSGDEFIVNAQTADKQGASTITALSSEGRFVATWQTLNASGFDIHAQVFEADGTISGSEQLVNTSTLNNQVAPAVAALSNGRFVVVWDDQIAQQDHDIHAQIFNSNGSKWGGTTEFAVTAAATYDTEPSVTALANGGFIVSWSKRGGGGFDIKAQVFDANGDTSGADFLINTTTTGHQTQSTLAGLPDGRFVAAWRDSSQTGGDASGDAIRARVFNADGSNPGAEFLVNTTTTSDQSEPSITVLADGRFVIGWIDLSATGGDQSNTAVRAQIFDPRESAVQLYGTDLNDQSVGTKFNDLLKGAGGADHLAGGAGPDTLGGQEGDDTLIGGLDNDTIAGGNGDDTAMFSQGLDKYTVSEMGNQIVVSGPDGVDILTDIEHLQFADGTVHVNDGNPLFATLYYMSENLDVFHAGANALDHFNTTGWHEGRDPNRWLDTSGYLAVNKDVAAAGINPLEHYHQSGWHEGRDPSAEFDTALYLINNSDVAAAGMDPLQHFLQFGSNEGRIAYVAIGPVANGFDAQWYLFNNPDVVAAGVDPLFHYNTVGWHEGRNPNAYFDTAGYLAHNPDVAAAGINPLQHYETIGWKEGRDPASYFDTNKYLAANPDVAAAHIDPLDHFLQYGIYEGRAPMSDGVWS